MASGFGGRYQGSVVDDADPIGEHRLLVIVPEVWGTEAGAWAVPSLPPGGAGTPAVGDLVWVTFEGGDTDYPIWDAGAAPDPDAVPADGHVGRYRALVADNVDPMEEHRLNVKIPEVLGDDSTAWAKAAPRPRGRRVRRPRYRHRGLDRVRERRSQLPDLGRRRLAGC